MTNLENIQRTGHQTFMTIKETLVLFVTRRVQMMVEKRKSCWVLHLPGI